PPWRTRSTGSRRRGTSRPSGGVAASRTARRRAGGRRRQVRAASVPCGNREDRSRGPERATMAWSGPAPAGGALVSRSNAPRGPPDDSWIRDRRTRAQIFRDRLGPPAVLQDRTDPGQGRGRLRAPGAALDAAPSQTAAYFLFTPWSTPCCWNQAAIVSASSLNCLLTFITPQTPPARPVFAFTRRRTAASCPGKIS